MSNYTRGKEENLKKKKIGSQKAHWLLLVEIMRFPRRSLCKAQDIMSLEKKKCWEAIAKNTVNYMNTMQ